MDDYVLYQRQNLLFSFSVTEKIQFGYGIGYKGCLVCVVTFCDGVRELREKLV
jgi:hypothetical protein